jgi:hypothetical protein
MKKILKTVVAPALAMLLLGSTQAADILSEEMYLEEPHIDAQTLAPISKSHLTRKSQ